VADAGLEVTEHDEPAELGAEGDEGLGDRGRTP
jgi:hypothetical protein